MESANLVTYFKEDEIKEIYNHLLEYSIRNYEKNEKTLKEFFEEKYLLAKEIAKKNKKIDLTNQELEEYLLDKQAKYQRNIKDNQELTTLNKYVPIIILKKNMPEVLADREANTTRELTNEEKVYYLLNFMTKYVKFSEEYLSHCTMIPPVNGLEFDFKYTLPVEHSVDGVLTEGQGLCDDICNTMVELGNAFDLPIGKRIVYYQRRLHAINTLEQDGKISLIDTARQIREHRVNDQYTLVDKDTLNNKDEYTFREDIEEVETVTLPKTNIRTDYSMTQIIHEIRHSLPSAEYQNNYERRI